MSNDLERVVERAIESLHQIAAELRVEPPPDGDVAARLEQIAAELGRPLAVIERARQRETERALRLRR